MTQKEVVEATKTPLTKETIKARLRELGIKSTSKVEVHTKLSSFGYIVNKEYDIIDALMEIITEGVILVPAHSSEFENPANWSNPPVPASWVPIINRKQGQVVSVSGGDMQVMDLETYETITMRIPEDLDPSPDDEIEYLEYEGQRKVV